MTTPDRDTCERCGYPLNDHALVNRADVPGAAIRVCPPLTFTKDADAPMTDARLRERVAMQRTQRADDALIQLNMPSRTVPGQLG